MRTAEVRRSAAGATDALPRPLPEESLALGLLLVEDALGDAELARLALEEHGAGSFTIRHATSLAEGLELLEEGGSDVMLLDLGLPDSQGLASLRAVFEHTPELPVVVLTGLADEQTGIAAVRLGAQEYLAKDGLPGLLLVRTLRHAVERQRLQAEVARQRRMYQELFERNPAGVVRVGDDRRCVAANPAAARMFGFDSPEGMVGARTLDFADPEEEAALRAELERQGEVQNRELLLRRLDGTSFHALVSARRVRNEDGEPVFEGTLLDISERRRAEAELRQSQKLEAVGRLAGGVAHDFNNILQIGFGLVDLLRMEGGDARVVTGIADELDGIFQRGANLTRQILLFARHESGRREPVQLGETVESVTGMLRRLLRETIELRVELPEEPLWAKADRGQIEQVITNLVVNASDAMPEGGRITVRAGAAGDRVRLVVEDDGTGIPAKIRERIFEPFFSTKGPGEGTGLGLSVVRGIVDDHDGEIEVESVAGEGSVFRVSLPRWEGGAEAVARAAPGHHRPSRGGGRRVLVVEDQAPLRRLMDRMLTALDYRPRAAESAEQALELAAAESFDVLLTDLVLPGASGLELARRLREGDPGLAVVLMSGYSDEDIDEATDTDGFRFLPKPFDLTTLSRALGVSSGGGSG